MISVDFYNSAKKTPNHNLSVVMLMYYNITVYASVRQIIVDKNE